MLKTKLRLTTAFVVIGAMAGLTACSSNNGSPANPPTDNGDESTQSAQIELDGVSEEGLAHINELYEAAISSGNNKVVVYGPSASTNKAMNAVFEERFPGITVIPQDQPDAQTLTKLETEAASGNKIGDIWFGGDSVLASSEPGICRTLDVVTTPADYEVDTLHEGRSIYFAHRYFGFVYNEDMVDAAEAPKSWEDLLDPKWKGKIAIGDMTVPGGIRVVLTNLMRPETEDIWGKEYIEQLKEQDLQIASSEPSVPADVASGRFPIGVGVFVGYFNAQKEEGAPIEFVFPLERGNFLTRSSLCLVDDGPNAEATELYVQWLYSPEGQRALAEKDNSYGTTPAAPGPNGLPDLGDIDKLPWSYQDPADNKPYFDYLFDLFTN